MPDCSTEVPGSLGGALEASACPRGSAMPAADWSGWPIANAPSSISFDRSSSKPWMEEALFHCMIASHKTKMTARLE
jgi:hypothetical protein